jgi:P4 family phage/plasmid primase-like protien
MNSDKYSKFTDFLIKHSIKNSEDKTITHTRIGDKELNIYGGSYNIPKEELSSFYDLYYEHIFTNKKKEYLTEKQNGYSICLDFDFRYHYDVEKKQHTAEDIQEMILLYLEEIKEYYLFTENKPFDIFVFEKPNVNRSQDKNMTKDGIHVIIGIQSNFIIQSMLREKMMEKIKTIWNHLPIVNTWESVFDEGVTKGTVNWQLYGSRKPANDAYELIQHYEILYDASDKEFMMEELDVQHFDLKQKFYKLSVQNDKNPVFEMNPAILNEYNKRIESTGNKPKSASKIKVKFLKKSDTGEEEEEEDGISLEDIKDKEILEKAVNQMLKRLDTNEYEIREIHEYTQILPEKYYEPGSHLLNRQVAFALKNTDERLFLSWVMLRSKASDFDYGTIIELYVKWKKYFNKDVNGITKRSIIYWAKQDNPEGYEKVKYSTIDYYIEQSIATPTDHDLAQVLKQMFKDNYICVSFDKKGIWYKFNNHKWEIDNGLSLRKEISLQMYDLYNKKSEIIWDEYNHYDEGDDRREFLKKKCKAITEIKTKLKTVCHKNNILREAMEIFYDNNFYKLMDSKMHLLGFNNGVVDFNLKVFRDGYPEDYITKSTNLDYIPFDETNPDTKIVSDQIHDFMGKLFPIPELKQYMWDHLSSCLNGNSAHKNQTFNIYHGGGGNGKSILADLMSAVLGDYKGTVPITLVTDKRGHIGGTSDEILKLKGVRYAVMQEPSKNVKLNEGIMKELTSGDPLQCRGLFLESEVYIPQFNLIVCTNNLFKIESNDDGTWRRIRQIDFLSKFVDENETYTDDAKYVFKKDKHFKDKFGTLAPVFISMLVKRCMETGGIVEDVPYVLTVSKNYRKNQDHITDFITEYVEKTNDKKDKVKKSEVYNQFKWWFQLEQGEKTKIPKGEELYDAMDKLFGHHTKHGWSGCKILYPESETGEVDEL